jgi:uncharacterized protein
MLKSVRVVPAVLALLLLTADSSFAQSSGESSLPLWEVKSGDRTVYLMGSVHLLRPEVYPLDEALYRAFDAASVVAFEVDFAELVSGAAFFAQRGMLPDGESLADFLPEGRHAELMERASEFGLPGQVVDRMKPWMASLTLSSMVIQAGGYRIAAGIDHHFYERAREREMSIVAFETVEEQLDVFDGLDSDQQVAMLKSTIDDLDTTVDMLDQATSHWQSGNARELAAMFRDSMGDQPKLLDRLLYQRNQNWIPQIEALLTGEDDAIVIVGMGHLVGDGSVIDLLEGRGYTVTQHVREANLVD